MGARKLQRIMQDENLEDVPSASTINRVLRRNGLITAEASRDATPVKRFEKEEPNEMWQSDFKGHFALRDNTRCYPLSIIDDCSRFCLNADARTNMQLDTTKASFIKAFRDYGLPKTLLCDNGSPWGSSQSTAITKFEVWLMEHDVMTTHIRPLRPQTQGKVERFNRSYKNERLKYYVPKDMDDAQRTREEYRQIYNEIRPHTALDYDHPSQHYRPSEREYRDEVSEWEYDQGAIVRNVKSTGYLTFRGQGYYLSEGLGGKTVMLRESTTTDGVYRIVFRDFLVASLDIEKRLITNRRIYRLHGDPRSGKL